MSDGRPQLDIVFIGLTITSSWGNGHATTYRSLLRHLNSRGHRLLFLERDKPWYADNRDMPTQPFCRTELYTSLDDLHTKFADAVSKADAVIVGSYVPEGVAVGRWATSVAKGTKAFYDIDTPVTLAKLEQGDYEYLSPELVPHYDLYLSFSGGPILDYIQAKYKSPCALPLYCSVDTDIYYPAGESSQWELGYLGTYSTDRQPKVDKLLIGPASQHPEGRFVVAGPQYPPEICWPENVERVDHLPPPMHRQFYNRQKFTLNVTRCDMVKAGFSPSVRLFEAAACGVPVISDRWPGLEQFFEPGKEILIAESGEDVLRSLHDLSEERRREIAQRARHTVLLKHTAAHRAAELERYLVNQNAAELLTHRH